MRRPPAGWRGPPPTPGAPWRWCIERGRVPPRSGVASAASGWSRGARGCRLSQYPVAGAPCDPGLLPSPPPQLVRPAPDRRPRAHCPFHEKARNVAVPGLEERARRDSNPRPPVSRDCWSSSSAATPSAPTPAAADRGKAGAWQFLPVVLGAQGAPAFVRVKSVVVCGVGREGPCFSVAEGGGVDDRRRQSRHVEHWARAGLAARPRLAASLVRGAELADDVMTSSLARPPVAPRTRLGERSVI